MSTRAGDGDDEHQGTLDREAILARRQRFVTAALAGLTTSTLATACPCLKAAPVSSDPYDDAAPAEAEAEEPDEDQDQDQDEAENDDGDSVEEASPADGEIPDERGDPPEPAP